MTPVIMPTTVTAGPDGGVGQVEVELGAEVPRKPAHDAEVSEVLHRGKDDQGNGDTDGLFVAYQQPQRVSADLRDPEVDVCGFLKEFRRFVQRLADNHSDDGREGTDDEQAAPAECGDNRSEQERCSQDPELESECNPGCCAGTHPRRYSFSGQRHADAEFAADADADAGDEPADSKVGVSSGQCGETGKNCKENNGVGQHSDPAESVGKYADDNSAQDGTQKCQGRQGARFGVGEVERGHNA
jgi:hypothetical protein